MGPELPLWEGVVRMLVVACLAGTVGLERELRDQEAGLRTHMLVGLGAALFVIVGNYSWSELDFGNQVGIVLDPSRVIAYVVTGIGFLGAGTIIKHGTNIKGLTTAASLWVVAAIGVSVGAGDYWLGVIATAIVLLSLWPLRKLADAVGLRATPDASPRARARAGRVRLLRPLPARGGRRGDALREDRGGGGSPPARGGRPAERA